MKIVHKKENKIMKYRVYMGYKKKDHFNFHISLFSIAILVFLGILIGWVSFRSFYRNKHIFWRVQLIY